MTGDNKKLVVITGVSKGLGRAMIDEFIQAGWLIAGCARSRANMDSLRSEYGDEHDFQAVDVSNAAEVAEWGEHIILRYGAPDLLINNASIINENKPLWTVSAEEFTSIMNINVHGTVNVIRSFVPSMVEKRKGCIVNISSYWGRFGEADVAPYCASKFAIEGLTQSLAKELPQEMAAVALDPGDSIDTAMLRSCSPESSNYAPSPESWARTSVPFIIGINSSDNGKSLVCP
ncbi:SDR family oxidoreductase [Paenibacillus sp. FJAT-27812]|uniref:SDR family oxidoreductase n=1 Tax=Paenibacillus sp. FJAT-27812 TaxID=1684143 RepID=UPI0006A7E953|nr:SDR family oxidoreductase [Paenibacillus sp. FJAT-27812]